MMSENTFESPEFFGKNQREERVQKKSLFLKVLFTSIDVLLVFFFFIQYSWPQNILILKVGAIAHLFLLILASILEIQIAVKLLRYLTCLYAFFWLMLFLYSGSLYLTEGHSRNSTNAFVLTCGTMFAYCYLSSRYRVNYRDWENESESV